MRTAQLIYHHEPEGWWAASPDLPGYVAVAETFEEARRLVAEGAPWFAEQELELHHLVPGGPAWWAAPSVGSRGHGDLALVAGRHAFSIQPSGLLAA